MSVYCIVLCFIVLIPVYYVLLCCASLSTNKNNNILKDNAGMNLLLLEL